MNIKPPYHRDLHSILRTVKTISAQKFYLRFLKATEIKQQIANCNQMLSHSRDIFLVSSFLFGGVAMFYNILFRFQCMRTLFRGQHNRDPYHRKQYNSRSRKTPVINKHYLRAVGPSSLSLFFDLSSVVHYASKKAHQLC